MNPDDGRTGALGERLHGLIGSIYDAALDPALWPAVLADVVDVLGARTATFLVHDLSGPDTSFRAVHGLPEGWEADYDSHFINTDLWLRELSRLPAGTPYLSHQGVAPEVLLNSEHYNDFLRRMGIFHGLGGFLRRQDNMAVLLGVHRPIALDAFDGEEYRLMQLLYGHFHRAVELHGRLFALQSEAQSGWAALDRLSVGVIVADGRARVIGANRAAEAILAAKDGLSVSQGVLVAARPRETTRLQTMIREAGRTSRGKGAATGGAMIVSRPSLRRGFRILVSPVPIERLRMSLGPAVSIPRALVFVSDPEQRPRPQMDVLKALYRLSPAESQMAALLARGIALGEIASHQGITRETARTRLKQIFAKTGVSRQADLVRLILAGAGGIDAEGECQERLGGGDRAAAG